MCKVLQRDAAKASVVLPGIEDLIFKQRCYNLQENTCLNLVENPQTDLEAL